MSAMGNICGKRVVEPRSIDFVFGARVKGMILGNIVGDAAGVPNHWVYDPVKMKEIVQNAKQGPAFCDPPGNGFYRTALGGNSCYADQTLCLLRSLVACGGYDASDYARRLADCFGRDSQYELEATDPENWPQLKQNPKDSDGNIIDEKRLWRMPLPGPWRHGSIKGFLENFVVKGLESNQSGSDDAQVDGCCKVPPLVALYAGTPELLPKVQQAVRVTQNTDTAVAFACGYARVLESIVLGTAGSVAEACSQAQSALLDPSRGFVTPSDTDVASALSNIEKLVAIPVGNVGEEVQKIYDLPRLSTALS
jgi:ADP-ribosylglycohydrolase